uniref:Uncharacterized protein n=1 Tax=Arundo donax TaxID=35708 RepID=A0A0A9AXY8_ARUDO
MQNHLYCGSYVNPLAYWVNWWILGMKDTQTCMIICLITTCRTSFQFLKI